jgi:hypothetical protein
MVMSGDMKKLVKWGIILVAVLLAWSWFGGAITGAVSGKATAGN